MSGTSRVQELLLLWEQRRARGELLTPEELCRDCPELLDEVRVAVARRALDPTPSTQYDTVAPLATPPLSDPSPVPAAPKDAPRFQPVRFHASGGLGEVYVALDRELNREVAVKQIQARHRHDPDLRRRFLVEAEVTGKLEHPGVVPVYGLGADDQGRPYYAMRFIRGESLLEAIERFHRTEPAGTGERALALRDLLGRFVDVCNAIAYAHSRGVVHRDIKPGNVMLGPYGETLVVDWGLARLVERTERDRAAGEDTIRPSDGDPSSHTRGAVGTPAYMSPEQAAGRQSLVGPPSDIYSLGATLYHLLAGRPPFDRGGIDEMLERVQRGEIPPPRKVNRGVPAALEAICLKAMALKREDRYATATALAADLKRWLADEPVSAYREPWRDRARRWMKRRRTLVTAGLVGVGVGVVALASVAVLLSVSAERERVLRIDAEYAAGRAVISATEARKKKEEADRERKRAEDSEAEAKRQLALAQRSAFALQLFEARSQVNRLPAAALAELLDARFAPPELRDFTWGHLVLQARRDLLVLPHGKPVWAVAYFPDGKTLATACADGFVRLWDAECGQEVARFGPHPEGVGCLAVAPDGRTLAAGTGHAFEMREVNIAIGKAGRPYNAGRYKPRPDARPGEVWLHPVAGGKAKVLRGHRLGVMALAYTRDGGRVYTAGEDGTVRIWSSGGEPVGVWRIERGPVNALAFSPDGKRLALGCYDNRVRVLDAANQSPRHVLEGLDWPVASVCWDREGKRVYAGGFWGEVPAWDLPAERPAVKYSDSGATLSLAHHAAHPLLIQASAQKVVRLRRTPEGEEQAMLGGHTDRVSSVAWNPVDRASGASGSWDGTARIWGLGDLGRKGLSDRFMGCSVAAVSPDGKLLATAGFQSTLRLWDIRNGTERGYLSGESTDCQSLTFTADGRRVVSVHRGGKECWLWELADGARRAVPAARRDQFARVAVSARARWLAGALTGGEVEVWDLAAEKKVAAVKDGGAVANLVFSSDETKLLVQSEAGEAVLYVADTGSEMLRLPGGGKPGPAAFGNSGRLLATTAVGKESSRLHFWDLRSGKKLATLAPQGAEPAVIVFSPEDSVVAVGYKDGEVRLIDGANFAPRATVRGHAGAVTSMGFSPDGRVLASCGMGGPGGDSEIKLWDPVTGKRRAALTTGSNSECAFCRFTPDGRTLITTHRSYAYLHRSAPARREDDRLSPGWPHAPLDEVLASLPAAPAERDDLAHVLLKRAAARARLGRLDDSLADLTRAEEVAGPARRAEAGVGRVAALALRGDLDGALKAFRRVAAEPLRLDWPVRERLASTGKALAEALEAAERVKEHAEALRMTARLREALSQKGASPRGSLEHAKALSALAEAELVLNRRKEAAEAYQAAEPIFARLARYWGKKDGDGAEAALLALICQGAGHALDGRPTSAAAVAERLVTRYPRDAVATYNAAALYGLAMSALGGGKPMAEWPADVKQRNKEYSDRAVELLEQAETGKMFETPSYVRHLRRAPDFGPMRQRKEYRELLRRVGKGVPGPP